MKFVALTRRLGKGRYCQILSLWTCVFWCASKIRITQQVDMYSIPGGGGVLGFWGDGYFRAENRKKFGTLRETLPCDLVNFPTVGPFFFQILIDFHQILVKISGDCDPFRGKFFISVILGPFQRLTHELVSLWETFEVWKRVPLSLNLKPRRG